MTPQTNLIYLWRHQDTPNNTEKYRPILKNTIWGNLKIMEFEHFEILERQGPTNPEDPFNEILKILNMGLLSSRKHELDFLRILNTGSISIQSDEMGIW